jgi:hypothetical protein
VGDRLGHFLKRLTTAPGQGETDTAAGKRQGDAAADARARACDESDTRHQ